MLVDSKTIQTLCFLTLTMFASSVHAQDSEYGLEVLTPKVLSRQQGDNRPERQLNINLFGRPLTIGGEYEFNPEIRRNLDLQSDVEDVLRRLDQKIEVEAFYDLGRNVYIFGEAKLTTQADAVSGEDTRRTTALERGQTWVFLHFPTSGFGIQVGRQAFKDKREWWWDADLDAIRLRLDRGEWRSEIAVAQEVADVSSKKPLDAEDEDVLRFIANAQWRWADRQTLDVFWLHHKDQSGVRESDVPILPIDEDEFDADLDWFGVRARGTFKLSDIGRFYYWGDVGWVSGKEDQIDYEDTVDGFRVVDDIQQTSVSGTAFDVGITWRWETETMGEINITTSFASGSGDRNISDEDDESFRQTGLQDNNGKFRGVDRFRYYGELFRPELSNMQIATLSVGKEVLSDSSVELLIHSYRQQFATPGLRDSRLDMQPLGLNRDLGAELDIVIGLEEWVHWEIELVAAVFRAGRAFGDAEGESSFAATLKVDYNF